MTTCNLPTLSEFRTRRDADARAEYAERLPNLEARRLQLDVAKAVAWKRVERASEKGSRADLEHAYECWLMLATDYWRTDTTIRAIEADMMRLAR